MATTSAEDVLSRRDLECDFCKQVTTLATRNLGDAPTENDIAQAIGNVCSEFSQGDIAKCDTFIGQYGNELIIILAEERDPSLACALLNEC